MSLCLLAFLGPVPSFKAQTPVTPPVTTPVTQPGQTPSTPSAKPALSSAATTSASLSGSVTDPSGALVPGATIRLSGAGGQAYTAAADSAGRYALTALPPGTYSVVATAPGFAAVTKSVTFGPGQKKSLDLTLPLETATQEVHISADQADTAAARDSGAIVLKATDLSLLSSDSGQMLTELQAMAASDGDTPGTMYIDGFSGGRLPPKSAIREIRINNNPFSAEYEDYGSGRIEVFTKPGTKDIHGEIYGNGSDAAFDSRNPFSPARQPFYSTNFQGDLSGPINSKMSYLFSGYSNILHNNAIVNAETLNADNQQIAFTDSVSSPTNILSLSPKIDAQVTPSNTLSARYQYDRTAQNNAGVGQLELASNGYNSATGASTLQVVDTQLLGPKFINEFRFQYIRTRTSQTPVSAAPTLVVQGAFTGGGSNLGRLTDNQEQYEFQNYSTLDTGKHFIRFGVRERLNRDANSSVANFNGEYIFSTIAAYQATVNGLQNGLSPAQIRAAGGGASQFNITTGSPAVAVLISDTSAYAEDTWKAATNFTVSYGLRFETQNHIADHADFAPRLDASYDVPGRDKKKPLLKISGGAGMFYDRLAAGDILQAARENGILQQQYVVTLPDTYPNIPPLSSLTDQTTSTTFQISPHYRSPYDIRTTVNASHSFGEHGSFTVGYNGVRSVHGLLTRNINAPLPGTYNPADPTSGVRPLGGTANVNEYDTMGIGTRNRLWIHGYFVNGEKVQVFGTYSVGDNHSDSNGGFPSNQYDLAADYGRSSYFQRQRLYLGAFFNLFGFSGGPFLEANTSSPFNIVVGQDLNGDSQFNDRPAFATDLSRPSVVVTKFGTFDTLPMAGQTIIPINYGNGPGNFLVNLNLNRDFHFGPIVKQEGDAPPPPKPGTKPPPPERRYTMGGGLEVDNLLNHVNAAPPVGTLGSPLFGHSNALSQGSSNTSANRTINFQTFFRF